MMNNYLLLKKNEFLTFFLLSSFPISLILGNLIINTYIVLLSISFFINFKENTLFINNTINYLVIFFFCILLIGVFFSQNWQNSLPRVLKIILIFFVLLESQRFFNKNNEKINLIFMIWAIIFFCICVDILFEFFFGHNLLGFTSFMPGRIASFFNKELVVGAFFHGFVLYSIAYIYKNYSKNKTIVIILALIVLSFLIGERSNFIRVLFSIFIFTSIILKIKPLKNLFIITLASLILTIFLNHNNEYKLRYYDQIKQIFQKNGITYFFLNTQYGAHQIVAYKIFKEYPLFGVGIKNFRIESAKKNYDIKNHSFNAWRQATHPHQVHLEFLSETGIIGYTSFLIFLVSSIFLGIKKFLISKNLYLLSSIVFIVSTLIPILPSGSFLSTFSSGIFWINFTIMSAFIVKKNEFFKI